LVVRKLNIEVTGFALAVALLATPAFADIPPADACMEADEGKACDNAGEEADQPGVCQADTCTRTTPDGPMTYDCHVCKATAGGGGDDDGAEDDGGCNVAAVPVGGVAGSMVPLLAFGLGAWRRRRNRS
jgi:MYXO-CTERM domain-containing protein